MNIIACIDKNFGIGYKNRLLYNIPEDMKFFKQMTLGKTVVMGRKTFESLKVKPLPERRNIVMTKDKDFFFKGVETVHSTNELLMLIESCKSEDVFVIGGAKIYRLLLNYCDTAFITKVYTCSTADSFMEDLDSLKNWTTEQMSDIKDYNGIRYRFIKYKKK